MTAAQLPAAARGSPCAINSAGKLIAAADVIGAIGGRQAIAQRANTAATARITNPVRKRIDIVKDVARSARLYLKELHRLLLLTCAPASARRQKRGLVSAY